MPADLPPAPSLPSPPRWNLLVLLSLALLFTAVVLEQYEPYSFLHGDGNFYATINRSILEGTLDQSRFQPTSWYLKDLGWNRDLDPGWSNVSLGADGTTFYPKHPILLPIVTTPLFWLWGMNGLLVANVALVVLTQWLAWRLACRVARPQVAFGVVLALSALPLFTRGAYAYSNDILYGALVLAGFERFAAGRVGQAGWWLGLSIWAKATNALLALPLGASLLVQRQWREAIRMAAWASLPVGVYLGLNAWMFGGPMVTAYHRIVVTENGRPVTFDISGKFHRPVLAGLRNVLDDVHQGLWKHTSVGLVTGALGLPLLVRRMPAIGVALLLSLVGYAYTYARFEYTYARFFTPWMALLCVAAAVAVDRLVDLAGHPRLADLPRRIGQSQPLGRAGLVAGAVALAALLVAGVSLARRSPHAWQAGRAIDHAEVERVRGDEVIPCDYYNPRFLKWECAQIEPEAWVRWGRALGDQCRLPGSDAWLWLHPNPGVTKRITFRDVPPGEVVVQYGMDRGSRFGDLRFSVLSGGKVVRQVQTRGIGTVEVLRIPAGERAGDLTFEVPAQTFDWRQLCLDARVQ